MRKGFTLAELLIALAILGVIATFTIPKVLQSQADSKKRAIVKEAASMVSQAFERYKLSGNSVSAATDFDDFFRPEYINYVKSFPSPAIWSDPYDVPPGVPWSDSECSSPTPCYLLHNGAMITGGGFPRNFGGTGSTNAVYFLIDTDGQYTGDSSGSIWLFLYSNGRMAHYGSGISPGTMSGGTAYNPDSSYDRAWFGWD